MRSPKQKLAIAQAIMEGQDVLLLDEPFNGLDVDRVEKSLNKKVSQNFLTSYNNEDIQVLCEHVFRVRNYSLEQPNLTLLGVYLSSLLLICSRLPIVPKVSLICFRERTYSNDIHSVLSSHVEAVCLIER